MRATFMLFLIAGAQTVLAAGVGEAVRGESSPLLAPDRLPFLAQVKTGSSDETDAKSGITVRVQPDQGELEIRFKGRRLLLYAFGTNQFKPYVRELYTLKGQNILRDAVPDHLHHHGLMYAIRVNGINFWEEAGQPGYERSVKLLSRQAGTGPDGLPQATFMHLIHWVANKDKGLADTSAAALLVERRTLTLAVNEPRQEVVLTWRGDFEVGPAASKVVLAGATYHGLGLRLPKGFDRVARHQNSQNLPYATQGKGDVTPAKWSSVSGVVEGQEIVITLCGSMAAQRGPVEFFTMIEPFAYLSATQGLDKEPLEYSAGDKFSLSYLLTVDVSGQTAESLNERQRLWEKSLQNSK